MSYEEEFEVFSSNVELLEKAHSYYIMMILDPHYDPKIGQAIQKHVDFFNACKYCFLQSVFIVLGRIFDHHSNSHSIYKIIKKLRDTKGLTADIKNIENIERFKDSLESIWNSDLKDIRRKIFAHAANLNDETKKRLIENYHVEKVLTIIKGLVILKKKLKPTSLNSKKIDLNLQTADKIPRKYRNHIKSLFQDLIIAQKESKKSKVKQ